MTFTYGRVRIAVRARDASHVAWLAEFLSPWFAVGDEADVDVTVTFRTVSGADWTAARTPDGGERPTEIGCFVLDSRVMRHEAWRERDGSLTVVDRELDAVYRVAPDAAAVEIVAGGREQAARVALMRVVRELATARAVRREALLLHAAAFARDRRGILLVGPKRAGKTTFLLRALAMPGTAFVANDRVVACAAGDDGIVHGMPSIIAVRPEVLARLAPLASRLRALGYHHAVTMTEARSGRAYRRQDGGADLTPAQLCDLLGVEAASGATVRAVVFPLASLDANGMNVERLSSQDAVPRLLAAVFGGRSTPVSEVFAGTTGELSVDAATVERRCRAFLAQVSVFACRFDPSTLETVDAAAVVDEVLR